MTPTSRLPALLLCTLHALAGCGTGADSAPPPGSSAAEVPAASSSGAAAERAAGAATPTDTPGVMPAAPPEQAGPVVDLLRAVPTELAVSSVYRDRADDIDRLVDGDLTTAWNSRSDDLVGAWVELRIPADATVTGVALTAGFTKPGGPTDLFTGNHRVRKVRVSRDGQALAELDLDVDSAQLQEFPLAGGGGVYRVEVLETVPGSRSGWREVCISELRLLGRAPSATPERRVPRTAVGALPAPRAAEAVDRAALAVEARTHMTQFLRAWSAAARDYGELPLNSGEPERRDADEARLLRTRQSLLRGVAALVDPVDALAADGARIAARGAALDPSLALAALSRVAEETGDPALRCDWGRMQARVHIAGLLAHLASDDNASESYYDPTAEGERDRRAMAQRSRAARPLRQLDASLRAGQAADASALAAHDLGDFDPSWTPLLTQLQTLATLCPGAPTE